MRQLAETDRGDVGTVNHLQGVAALLQRRFTEARQLAEQAIGQSQTAHAGMPIRDRHAWALSILLSVELNEGQAAAARRILAILDPNADDQKHHFERVRLALLEGDDECAARGYRRFLQSPTGHRLDAMQHTFEVTAADLSRLERLAADLPEESDAKPLRSDAPMRSDESAVSPQVQFIGRSEPAQQVRGLIQQYAPLDVPVLITGETGTGKEVVARLLHASSERADRPFVAVNCSGMTETLIESELFGHVKGAFTGADANRRGLFEAADRGTILLDEFHTMSPRLQSTLLRVLESHEIRPVGGTQVRHVQARVLVATNESLQSLVEAGQFRADLFYRVARLHIDVPPLSERRGDIGPLVRHFLQPLFGDFEVAVSNDLIETLQAHDWPGNVRELRNVVERLALLAGDRKVLDAALLERVESPKRKSSTSRPGSARARSAAPVPSPPHRPVGNVRNRVSRQRLIMQMFDQHRELTQQEIVRTLGCSPNTLRKDLRELSDQGLIDRVSPTAHPRTAYFVRA